MAEEKTFTGLPSNTEAAFAYVLGWLTGIAFLLLEKNDKFVRFHALQSVVVFGGITVIAMFPIIGWMLSPLLMMAGFILWLFLIYKAYKGEEYKLPVIGPFVAKQLNKL